MEPLKVGIREFRSQLPYYLLETGQPVAITRHGETIGFFIPSREREPASNLASLQSAAAKLDALLASAHQDAETLAEEFNTARRQK